METNDNIYIEFQFSSQNCRVVLNRKSGHAYIQRLEIGRWVTLYHGSELISDALASVYSQGLSDGMETNNGAEMATYDYS